MKYTYTIYSTKDDTYIQPKKNKVPSKVEHMWEIDCEYPLCTKKLKLQGHISNIDQIAELIERMKLDIRDMEVPNHD